MKPLWDDEIDATGRKLMPPDGPVAWLGVFPAHSLPKRSQVLRACIERSHMSATDLQSFGAAFVVNTDLKGKEGDHWVAFFMPSPYHEAVSHGACFFDPLGRTPIENGHEDWDQYLREWSQEPYKYNASYIQASGTNGCGHLCLLWLFYILGQVPFPYGCGMTNETVRSHFGNMFFRTGRARWT